jgi:hypothetical protein
LERDMTAPEERELEQSAAEEIDAFDTAALAQVAALYARLDDVPSGLIDRIAFGITLDALHAEIAQLVRSPALAGVRADETAANTVTFTSESMTAMMTITPTSPELARVDGWVTPGGERLVDLRTPAGTVRTRTDEDGRFVLDGVTRGLVQFTFRTPDGEHAVVTPALEI